MKLGACQKYDPKDAPDGWTVEPIKRRLWLEYGSGLTEQSRAQGAFPVFGSNGPVGRHDSYTVEGPGILVGRKGSVGEVHFSESNFWPIDTVYYVRRIKGDDWRYLFYLLGYLNLGLLNAATGVPGLTRRDAHDILGAFPDPSEQRRIAAALKLADDAIAKTKAELEATRELKRSLMQTLFVSGMPGRHSEFVETKIGRIPKHWEVKRVGKALIEPPISGTSPQSRPDPPGTPILNVSCVKGGVCDSSNATYVDVTEDDIERYRAKVGDFYVLRGNGNRDYVATGGLLRETPPDNSIYSDKLIRLRFDPEKVTTRFIPYMWQSHAFLTRLQSKAESGSGLWMMSKRDIAREFFAYPPIPEKEEIVTLLDGVETQAIALENKCSALQAVNKSLLQNLITGKIRIPAKEQSTKEAIHG
jgi:type I restriction enzyme, S subunit